MLSKTNDRYTREKMWRSFILSVSLLFFIFSFALKAQVTFIEPDSGRNYGINVVSGLMGMAWGDYDADGDLDLLLAGAPSVLYRNDISITTPADTSRFIIVSATASAPGNFFFDPGGTSSLSALWGEFNGDGKLDLGIGGFRLFINYLCRLIV